MSETEIELVFDAKVQELYRIAIPSATRKLGNIQVGEILRVTIRKHKE